MHEQALEFVRRQTRDQQHRSVLEIGSCDVNGSVRPCFPDADHYHGIDIVDGPGVDEVADAADWRPDEAHYDVVVSTEVLEHAPRWRDVLTNSWDALAPGGHLIFTFATDPRPVHSAVDGWELRPGEHYANVAPSELEEWLEGVGCQEYRIEIHRDRGDCYLDARHP